MRKYIYKPFSVLLGLVLSWSVAAQSSAELNPSHPDRYQVVEGDSLWSIAARFLRDPWRWPEVWQANPQVQNPHRIYPGDIIELSFIGGQPQLSLQRGGLVKLSPRIRVSPLESAIPAIPVDAIKQFLTRPYVVDGGALDAAPYILSFGEQHLIGSSNLKAYVRGIANENTRHYDVIRPGKPYKDAETGELLGYEALLIGGAELQKVGDPATLLLTNMQLEFLVGDRLIPDRKDIPLDSFVPRAPDTEVRGSIISVLKGVSQIGQYDVVVLDRGAHNGLQPGMTLAINHRGPRVRDTVSKAGPQMVKLPDEPAGALLVFRTFPRVSFGLIMHATRSIHVGDRVLNP